MSWLTRNHNQTVTHWAATETLDSFGAPGWDSPIELSARWEDRSEELTNMKGEEILARSVVFLGIDVSVGDYLFLGVSAGTDPTTIKGAFKVKDFRKIPQIRGEDFERTAYL